MTCSVVAVVTDVLREGKPVIGYGFNSNGRYGQGALMRERILPRIMEADPASLIDEANDNLDPFKIWRCMMTNEKPGGPRRAVGRGRHDRHGDLGRGCENCRQAALQALGERYGGGSADTKVWVYAAEAIIIPARTMAN